MASYFRLFNNSKFNAPLQYFRGLRMVWNHSVNQRPSPEQTFFRYHFDISCKATSHLHDLAGHSVHPPTIQVITTKQEIWFGCYAIKLSHSTNHETMTAFQAELPPPRSYFQAWSSMAIPIRTVLFVPNDDRNLG
ncbi:hypothetical protein BOTNAR_0091g00140 [Botryotinia narcissicola]|uniref:Uncharacterized protein n=1 Tax=Botryotinia narcissicola TaxID=278944 RepID=A0A4Z1IXN4_9HELO|nr:hypothetical protein BOTNAR_0091g00140 [Botryotinia narcissicola]